MWNKNKYVDWDQVKSRTKRLSDWVGSKTRHTQEKFKDNTQNLGHQINLSFKEARNNLKNKGPSALRPNIDVSQATKNIKNLMEGNRAGQVILKISQKKWFRNSLIGIGIGLGLNVLQKSVSSFDPQPALPRRDERGYDIMTQTMTDFGSPVKLLKTASKTITPYYSSVRKGIITTTSNITDKNMALYLNKRAIGHTRY